MVLSCAMAEEQGAPASGTARLWKQCMNRREVRNVTGVVDGCGGCDGRSWRSAGLRHGGVSIWQYQPMVFIPETGGAKGPVFRFRAQSCIHWIIFRVVVGFDFLILVSHIGIPVFALPTEIYRNGASGGVGLDELFPASDQC